MSVPQASQWVRKTYTFAVFVQVVHLLGAGVELRSKLPDRGECEWLLWGVKGAVTVQAISVTVSTHTLYRPSQVGWSRVVGGVGRPIKAAAH